jgi:hypothetical protein
MGMNWTTRAELVEAIPPAFSLFLGRQIIQTLTSGQSNGRYGQAGESEGPQGAVCRSEALGRKPRPRRAEHLAIPKCDHI